MPRPKLQLEDYVDEISYLLHEREETIEDVIDFLRSTYGISLNRRTLIRRMKEWGISKRADNACPTLVEAIRISFFDGWKNDDEIAEELQDAGFRTSARQVQAVRLVQGMKRRARDADELARQKEECAQAVADALANGTVRNYGINLLWAHLRRHNLLVRRDDVNTVLRSLDPVDVRERRPNFKPKLRGEYMRRIHCTRPKLSLVC